MSNIAEQLMIVNLSIKQWTPRKYDKKASQEIADAHGASGRADEIGRYNKILVELASIKPVQAAMADLRKYHYSMTAPWKHDGEAVMPADLFFAYTEEVAKRRDEIEALADEFVYQEYDAQRERAKERLNGLFNADDYPPAHVVRSKFSVDVAIEPIANPDSCLIWKIGKEAAEEAQANAADATRQALENAQQNVVDRLVENAREFVEKVNAFSRKEKQDVKRNVFFASAITNLTDVVDIVRNGLNITGDSQLDDLANELGSIMEGLEPDKIKGSLRVRNKKVKQVEETLDKFAGVFG